ncbi:MAG: JAB domain-containing protein [Desulfamplus sp.]|nr:JAB domain-containing protein [Desulfamplus sp.]
MRKYQQLRQQEFSGFSDTQVTYKKFISVFRISLVRDRHIKFEQKNITTSQEAQGLLKRLIETQGNPDREQFCILLLNSKNQIIGLNIVSTGDLSSAMIHPREVLKPAILANAASMILCHNHPSGDLTPSDGDVAVTKKIVKAAKVMCVAVHEHLIISMYDNSYYSFADSGLIQQAYQEAD